MIPQTKFNKKQNRFQFKCPSCGEWKSDGKWFEAFGECESCSDTQGFWLDKYALARNIN